MAKGEKKSGIFMQINHGEEIDGYVVRKSTTIAITTGRRKEMQKRCPTAIYVCGSTCTHVVDERT
jgi:hypothetical protein